MLATIADVVLGLVLLGSAGAKLAAPTRTRAALATFGLVTPRARALAWSGALAVETGLGLGVALAGIAVLAVLLLALAREVGELRLALPPQLPLEIEGEGPERGTRAAAIDRFVPQPSARFALAVFASDGCPLCQALAPAVAALRRDPLLAVETFDEREDSDVWRALGIPGSPYAVVLALDGTVLAQGTFNSARQLEALVATGEARERELVHA
jgi:hypothetical protein